MDKKIIVIGLGAGDLAQMPLGIYRLLKNNSANVYLRTKEHPVVKELEQEDLSFYSFDQIYEDSKEFMDVYETIVKQLFLEVNNHSEIIYAVPGHPLVAEKTVQLLLNQADEEQCEIKIEGGQSFLDSIFTALKIDPIEGFQMVDATGFNYQKLNLNQHIFISQVYDVFIASEVKLSLMEILPDDYEIAIVTSAGNEDEVVSYIPLYELDRRMELNNLTSVYVPPVEKEELLYHEFATLREVIATLRGPNGCPWDQKQTHESLKKYLIEEAYEVIDAIDAQDDDNLIEELGDVLLQVMLHSQIGEDAGYFTVQDVISSVTEKMIRRHPHVFGDTSVETSEEVVQKWEEIKKKEKKNNETSNTILEGIPKHLPGLYRAFELQRKAAKVGFDWDVIDPIWDKVNEEIQEFKQEVKQNNQEELVQEFGDILFALVNIGRFYNVDPEDAIQRTNRKFYNRFNFIEEKAREKGKDMKDMSLTELDEIWEEAKRNGK